MNVLCENTHVHHVHAWCLWQSEGASDSLDLKVQRVVNHHVSAGTSLVL